MKFKIELPYIFHNYYKPINKFIITDDDKDKGELIARGITSRDSDYSGLLSSFRKTMKVRSIVKEIHKWIFFWIIVGLGIVLGIYLFNIIDMLINNIKNIEINKLYVSLISSSVSLVSIIISIPIIITKYLFNTKEDDNITTIISKTQEHDHIQMNLLSSRFMKEEKTSEDNTSDINEENSADNKYEKIIENILNKN